MRGSDRPREMGPPGGDKPGLGRLVHRLRGRRKLGEIFGRPNRVFLPGGDKPDLNRLIDPREMDLPGGDKPGLTWDVRSAR